LGLLPGTRQKIPFEEGQVQDPIPALSGNESGRTPGRYIVLGFYSNFQLSEIRKNRENDYNRANLLKTCSKKTKNEM
jgi:hypothetical protein